LQPLIHELYRVLKADLDECADVTLTSETASFRSALVRVMPVRAGAAEVDLWEENGSVVASAGDRAQFVFDGPSGEQMFGQARSLVAAVADGRLADKYLGSKYVKSSLGEIDVPKIGRLVRWAAYC
jgi:hypothetical protein